MVSLDLQLSVPRSCWPRDFSRVGPPSLRAGSSEAREIRDPAGSDEGPATRDRAGSSVVRPVSVRVAGNSKCSSYAGQ